MVQLLTILLDFPTLGAFRLEYVIGGERWHTASIFVAKSSASGRSLALKSEPPIGPKLGKIRGSVHYCILLLLGFAGEGGCGLLTTILSITGEGETRSQYCSQYSWASHAKVITEEETVKVANHRAGQRPGETGPQRPSRVKLAHNVLGLGRRGWARRRPCWRKRRGGRAIRSTRGPRGCWAPCSTHHWAGPASSPSSSPPSTRPARTSAAAGARYGQDAHARRRIIIAHR
jgi:hypothetical protein